jgi:hypothetical protein
MASVFEDEEDIIKRVTSAERIEATVLGITLHFADGHSLFLDQDATDAIGRLLYRVNRKALDELRAEARKTY